MLLIAPSLHTVVVLARLAVEAEVVTLLEIVAAVITDESRVPAASLLVRIAAELQILRAVRAGDLYGLPLGFCRILFAAIVAQVAVAISATIDPYTAHDPGTALITTVVIVVHLDVLHPASVFVAVAASPALNF